MIGRTVGRTALCLGLALACAAGAACHTHSAEVSGPRGETLTLVVPATQTFRRGETNVVLVNVHRADVAGPIAVRFDDLPKGLEMVERDVTIASGSESARVTLYAKPDADLVSGHAVRVTAAVPDGKSVSQYIHVTVRAN
jgi:hypothetical protein